MDSGMFYGIQNVAIAALASSDSWFEELNKIYDKRRHLIYKLATLLGSEFDTNSSGLFVWAKLNDTRLDSEAFIDKILYKYNLFITPGTIFGSQGEGYIRFSLCVEESQIRKAIERITIK
jgi:aspartate/methionine/tyrosine aminotransferase